MSLWFEEWKLTPARLPWSRGFTPAAEAQAAVLPTGAHEGGHPASLRNPEASRKEQWAGKGEGERENMKLYTNTCHWRRNITETVNKKASETNMGLDVSVTD